MSTIVPIPGGTATLRDPAELRERHRRLIQTAMTPLASVFAKLPPELLEAAAGKGPAAEKARAKAEKLQASAVTTRQEAAAILELKDAVIVALLKDWDLDLPLPDMDTVQDLDHDLYEALDKATFALTPAVMGATTPTNFEPQPLDRDSPFDESGTSALGSRARANGSSGKRRTTGANTNSGATSAV
jgi:hypothetical protein